MSLEEFQVVELRIPNKPEYVSVARLTLSGIASRMNFSYDEVEDLKIAIAEACTNAIQHAYGEDKGIEEEVIIRYLINPQKLIIEVQDKGRGFDPDIIGKGPPGLDTEGGLGIFLIKALVDEVKFKVNKEGGTQVQMIKYRKE